MGVRVHDLNLPMCFLYIERELCRALSTLDREDETYRISTNRHGPVQSNTLHLSSLAPSPRRCLGSHPRIRSDHAALIVLPPEGEEKKREERENEARIPR